jgi:hypothetical protein
MPRESGVSSTPRRLSLTTTASEYRIVPLEFVIGLASERDLVAGDDN